jgi:hypothetical protein
MASSSFTLRIHALARDPDSRVVIDSTIRQLTEKDMAVPGLRYVRVHSLPNLLQECRSRVAGLRRIVSGCLRNGPLGLRSNHSFGPINRPFTNRPVRRHPSIPVAARVVDIAVGFSAHFRRISAATKRARPHDKAKE